MEALSKLRQSKLNSQALYYSHSIFQKHIIIHFQINIPAIFSTVLVQLWIVLICNQRHFPNIIEFCVEMLRCMAFAKTPNHYHNHHHLQQSFVFGWLCTARAELNFDVTHLRLILGIEMIRTITSACHLNWTQWGQFTLKRQYSAMVALDAFTLDECHGTLRTAWTDAFGPLVIHGITSNIITITTCHYRNRHQTVKMNLRLW